MVSLKPKFASITKTQKQTQTFKTCVALDLGLHYLPSYLITHLDYPAGEFEAYLALEKQLAETKDTNARIQLMTALKLQQRRMVENWKRPSRRPKVRLSELLVNCYLFTNQSTL